MKKEIWKSKTMWGCVALFVAGGLEAIGVSGSLAYVEAIAGVIGLPLTGYGLRSALK